MAITKMIGAVHPASGGKYKVLGNLIKYVLNPEKTEGGLYTGSVNCFKESALQEMINTTRMYGKDSEDPRNRLGYHFTISWAPEENISSEEAFRIIEEFVNEYLGAGYEAVYSVHEDQEHKHGHIAFNSVSFATGYKYRYEDGDWAKVIQPITDRICKKYGFHTLEEDVGMSLYEIEEERIKSGRAKNSMYRKIDSTFKGESHSNKKYHKDSNEKYSWNEHVSADVDYVISQAESYEDFERLLKEMGYLLKYGNSEKFGPYLKVKAMGMEIYRKTYQLGPLYTLQAIKDRILIKNEPLPEYTVPNDMRMVIPIRYFRSVKKLPLSPVMKRYYRRLYELGVIPKHEKRNYRVSKDVIAKCDLLEQQVNIILQNNIVSEADALKVQQVHIARMQELEHEKALLCEKHAPYQKMLRAYRKAKRLKGYADEYSAGKEDFKKYADEYENQVSIYKKYGVADDEIEQYSKDYTAEFKAAKEKIKKEQLRGVAIDNIINEFRNNGENLRDLEADMVLDRNEHLNKEKNIR